MAYVKIFSRTPIDTDQFIPWLRFDYKCEDEDSNFYPDETYEYIYELDEDEESEKDFLNNLHWIYGRLDVLQVQYGYDILDGEWKNIDHPEYIKGYDSALANPATSAAH